jgi:hypothetical protein
MEHWNRTEIVKQRARVMRRANDKDAIGDSDVQVMLASDHSCPPEMLRVLADNGDWSVRETVAESPGCPPDVLEMLVKDVVHRVGQTALANPALPRHVLAMWELVHQGRPGPGRGQPRR